MTAFLLLIACLLLGAIVARIARPPVTLASNLNWWVIHIALPALVLALVPKIEFHWGLWYLAASMWLVFFGAWALFACIGKWRRWSRARIGALTLVCGLGNTSFIGYPMLEALRGQEGLALGVIADQLGCFVMLAIGGAIITSIYSTSTPRAPIHLSSIAGRVLFFPAFVALVIGATAGAWGGWPSAVDLILTRIGNTLVPIALFSVGLQMRLQLALGQVDAVVVGLAFKLALAPLAIYVLGLLFGISGMTLTVSVLQAGMAPMISAAILAEQHQLEPRLANLVLIVGIVLSFATVPLLNAML
ncbi:MAG: AEC family transporter [Candidatus Obscuribacterales bacterium]|nr:AEC family transporter [Steroidobacteraceae bacterium]